MRSHHPLPPSPQATCGPALGSTTAPDSFLQFRAGWLRAQRHSPSRGHGRGDPWRWWPGLHQGSAESSLGRTRMQSVSATGDLPAPSVGGFADEGNWATVYVPWPVSGTAAVSPLCCQVSAAGLGEKKPAHWNFLGQAPSRLLGAKDRRKVHSGCSPLLALAHFMPCGRTMVLPSLLSFGPRTSVECVGIR